MSDMTDIIAELVVDLTSENMKLRAEVERLTREREEHRAEVEGLRAGIERLRAALESVRIDGPDNVGQVWMSFVCPGAARAYVVVGYESVTVSCAALMFEETRRSALEGKP